MSNSDCSFNSLTYCSRVSAGSSGDARHICGIVIAFASDTSNKLTTRYENWFVFEMGNAHEGCACPDAANKDWLAEASAATFRSISRLTSFVYPSPNLAYFATPAE